MKSSHQITTVFLGLLLGLWSGGAGAQSDPVYVDCDAGDLLFDAVRTEGDWGEPLTIYVSGTCYERVTVPRNRVTINGQPEEGGPIAVLDGSIVNWGMGITVRNIKITGENEGVVASGGRTRLINVDISGNYEIGILVARGGSVSLNNSRVFDSGWEGVEIQTGSLTVGNSEIAGNEVGIVALMGRVLLFEGTSIVNNRDSGVVAELHTSILADGAVTIERNGKHGVKLALDSGLLTRGPVSINDNGWVDVVCEDHESNAKFEDGNPGRVRCPGVSWK